SMPSACAPSAGPQARVIGAIRSVIDVDSGTPSRLGFLLRSPNNFNNGISSIKLQSRSADKNYRMTRSDPYLKAYVESRGDSGLRAEIASVWQSIRDRNLYSGGPRSSQTDQAIARALAALRVASQTNDRVLLAEACRLMAHTLNADEQYEQSVEYYQKAIALFESGESAEQAARTRLGYMAALSMMGKYDEAMVVAAEAEQWFQANKHLSGLAKLYTNIGNLSYRREQHQIAITYHSKARSLFEQLEDLPAL